MRKHPWVVVIGLVLAMTGCGKPIDHGTVTERKYRAPYDYTYYVNGACTVWITSGSGANQTQYCVQYQQIPMQAHVDAAYELCMAYKDDSAKIVKGCRDATQHEYEKYQVGQEYP